MSFLTEIITIILSTYLAFTNMLALEISSWFADDSVHEYPPALTTTTSSGKPTSLPSIANTIPTILLQDANYQKAALAGATGLTGATTDDPLEALVNIFCTFTTKEYVRTTTGTGFFIDPDGVIMTNAHVAQFLLLDETEAFGETACVIRSGNPATPQYQAELLYISPAWIVDNATVMNDAIPMGTGERDYALLYASKRVDNQPLPAQFPALAFSTKNLPNSIRGNSVTAAGYPATKLLLNGPAADLVPKKDTTAVSELYTFGSNYADVFSIRGSAVGAEGSSGGPVVNKAGQVIGIIVTRGDDSIDGAGSLRAITISHINRTITEETNFSLKKNLAGNLSYRSRIFSETLSPFLSTILEQANTPSN